MQIKFQRPEEKLNIKAADEGKTSGNSGCFENDNEQTVLSAKIGKHSKLNLKYSPFEGLKEVRIK